MSIFDDEDEVSIYAGARQRAEYAVQQDAERAGDVLPSYSQLVRAPHLVHCSRTPTVHGAIMHYAEQLGRCRMWLSTFAANRATFAVLAQISTLRAELLVFSRVSLTRDVAMLELAREWAGPERVVLARVHAKIAVLASDSGERFVAIYGSANMSKNTGHELMALDADPQTAKFLISTVERIAQDGRETAGERARRR